MHAQKEKYNFKRTGMNHRQHHSQKMTLKQAFYNDSIREEAVKIQTPRIISQCLTYRYGKWEIATGDSF